MNKKNEIIRLIIYFIIIIVTILFYLRVKAINESVWVCIKAPCPQPESTNIIPFQIGCSIVVILFGILSIISIIKLLKK